MKKNYDRQAGFTLVEIIVVMGIMAILAGVTVTSMSLLTAGNSKKSAAKFNSALSEAQVNTMSYQYRTFLYLYRDASGKIVVSTVDAKKAGITDDTSTSDVDERTIWAGYTCWDHMIANASKMRTLEVADKTVKVKVGSGGYLGDHEIIKITYDKATGAFVPPTQADGAPSYLNGKIGWFAKTDGSTKNNATFISELTFEGKNGKKNFTVKMVQVTGKHFVVK